MRWIKLLLVFGSLVLLLSIGSTISADGPGIDVTSLISPGDLLAFGSANVVVPEGPVEKQSTGSPTGWAEARSITIFVNSEKPGGGTAIVTSRAYKFTSEGAAKTALRAVQDPGKALSWMTKAEGASLLSKDQQNLLTLHSASWRAWHGTDNHGFPVYAVWIQEGSGIAEVQMTVNTGQEQMGMRLVDRVIKRLVDEKAAGVPSTDKLRAKPTPTVPPGPGPQWWYSGSRAYRINDEGNWEYTAVWSLPYGYDPHYYGPGGDTLTCISDHSCISNWNWPQSYPESKLLLPKSWLVAQGCCGAWVASNYAATVWVE